MTAPPYGAVLLLALFLTGAAGASVPQPQYSVVSWQQDNGLPHDTVNAITQTEDGYLWVATKAGLGRFDGVRFVVYRDSTPVALKDAEVYSLAADGDSVWVGTFGGGLSHVRGLSVRTYTAADGLPSDFVAALARARDGTLWVGTESGLCRKGAEFECYAAGHGLSHESIRSLVEGRDGTIWAGTMRGLSRVASGEVKAVPLPPPHADAAVWALAEDGGGALWVGTSFGLFRRHGGSWTHYSRADGLPADDVRALRVDREGVLWAATRGGVARLAPASGARLPFSPVRSRALLGPVTFPEAYALYEDREGHVWVGTAVTGLSRLRRSPLRIHATGLEDPAVWAVHHGQQGLWLGTRTSVCRKTGEAFECRPAPVGPVWSVAEDGPRVWAAGEHGVVVFDGNTVRPVALPPEAVDPPLLLRDARGRILILAGERLLVGNGGRAIEEIRLIDAEGRGVGRLRAIVEAEDGSFWIGTRESGLFHVGADRAVRRYSRQDGLPSDAVMALVATGGDLWIGTRAGLCRLRGGRFTTLTVRDGLPTNFIHEIVEDRAGSLWMLTPMGVYGVAKEALHRRADGGEPFRPLTFGLETRFLATALRAGLRSAATVDGEGRLWLATRAGLVAVHPADAGAPGPVPVVHVEEVVGDTVRPPGDERIVLAPGEGRRLAVHYTGLAFSAPERLRFQYQLKGLDADWVDAGTRRVAYFTNLAPKAYEFVVRACDTDGRCSAEASRELTLAPFFYETDGFKVAMIGGVLALVWGSHRLRVGVLSRRFAAVLAERRRIARDLHDGLDQAFTALALHFRQVAKAVRPQAESDPSLSRRLELTEALLENARLEARRAIEALRSRDMDAPDLASAMRALVLRLREALEIRIDLEIAGDAGPVSSEVESHALRICQEAVTNAVRHGKAERVTVHVAIEAGAVSLRIHDDGSGFDVSEAAKRGGYGLAGMEERARAVGGRVTIRSAPGEGTDIEARFPRGSLVAGPGGLE